MEDKKQPSQEKQAYVEPTLEKREQLTEVTEGAAAVVS